jgi:hypothetical protein
MSIMFALRFLNTDFNLMFNLIQPHPNEKIKLAITVIFKISKTVSEQITHTSSYLKIII